MPSFNFEGVEKLPSFSQMVYYEITLKCFIHIVAAQAFMIKGTIKYCTRWDLLMVKFCTSYTLYRQSCTSCNLYKLFVQVATCTGILYKLQLIQNLNLYITYIYVTGKLCNQAFHEMPKNSRHFVNYTTCLVHIRQIVKYNNFISCKVLMTI